ncbi:17324_t:CDS:2, partial [Acaulospora colombiana]
NTISLSQYRRVSISSLFIHHEYRGKSFARQAWLFVEEEARKIGAESIEVSTSITTKMGPWYERMGYKKFKVIDNYWLQELIEEGLIPALDACYFLWDLLAFEHSLVHLLSAPKSLRPDVLVNGSSPKPAMNERVLCIATSCVRITSEIAAQKFLDEKYAIGQADFCLLEVSTGWGNEEVGRPGKEYLRRRYLLKTEGFECEIDEVFPDREMFANIPEDWLAASDPVTELYIYFRHVSTSIEVIEGYNNRRIFSLSATMLDMYLRR